MFAGVSGFHSGLLSIAEIVSFVCGSQSIWSPSQSKSASALLLFGVASTTSLNTPDRTNVSSFFVSNFTP